MVMRDQIAADTLLQNVPDVDWDVLNKGKPILTVAMLKTITQISIRLPSSCITVKGLHIY
jgi:hypothetical protein